VHFTAKHPTIYNHRRVMELDGLQYKLFDYTLHNAFVASTKRIGIYEISTTQFSGIASQEDIQDQLGRTDREVSLALHNKTVALNDEEKKRKIGKLVSDFSDIIEYDPEKDMLFNKVMFRYCGVIYLSTDRAKIEGIHSDFEKFKLKTQERWWGELMYLNKIEISDAYAKWLKNHKEKPHKNFQSIKQTFDHLFELERQFSPSSVPSKIVSAEKMRELNKILERI